MSAGAAGNWLSTCGATILFNFGQFLHEVVNPPPHGLAGNSQLVRDKIRRQPLQARTIEGQGTAYGAASDPLHVQRSTANFIERGAKQNYLFVIRHRPSNRSAMFGWFGLRLRGSFGSGQRAPASAADFIRRAQAGQQSGGNCDAISFVTCPEPPQWRQEIVTRSRPLVARVKRAVSFFKSFMGLLKRVWVRVWDGRRRRRRRLRGAGRVRHAFHLSTATSSFASPRK